MNITDQIIEKTERFADVLKDKAEFEKNLFHYNSIQNLSRRIIHYWGQKPTKLKEILLEYFSEVEKRNYSINSKLESSRLHNKYVLPIEKFLITKEHFVTSSHLRFVTILGGLVDIGLFFYLENYWYPIFLVVLFSVGYYKRKQAQKSNKYSKMFW